MLGKFFLKPYAGKIFWKLYAGNLLMETMMGVITASHYGFKAAVPGALVENPGSADLSRTKRREQSYRKCRAGDGDAQPMLVNSEAPVGKRNSDEVNRKALA